MFIKLKNNKRINTNQIILYDRSGNESIIIIEGGIKIYTDETIEELDKLINNTLSINFKDKNE